MSILTTFLEGVFKTSTSGLIPQTGIPSVQLAPTKVDDILKSIEDPDLDAYLTTSIEIQQIQMLEQDAIFKMVDEFCNSYIEALKQGPTSDNSQELSASGEIETRPETHHRQVVEKDDVEGSETPNSKKRRGNLPKASTNILKKWLYDHLYHPYPTEEEKKMLESRTGMTLNQISNWFINARRRILQPMLESVRQQNLQASQAVVGNSPPILHSSPATQSTMDQNMMMHHPQLHSYRPNARG